MINPKYAALILDKLFQTQGEIGINPEDELAELKRTYSQLVVFTDEGGGGSDIVGISSQVFAQAYKDDGYTEGSRYTELLNIQKNINNSRWYTTRETETSTTVTYSQQSGSSRTKTIHGFYLHQMSWPTDRYPRDCYLGLFTKMPEADGTDFEEPTPIDPEDTTFSYKRMNMHWSILTGEEILKSAEGDTENNNISTITNDKLILFPEVVGQSWGHILGFGIFESETSDNTAAPILWGRLSNENAVDATAGHVPLFRVGDFKVTLS